MELHGPGGENDFLSKDGGKWRSVYDFWCSGKISYNIFPIASFFCDAESEAKKIKGADSGVKSVEEPWTKNFFS